ALVCPYNMFDRPGGIPQFIVHLHHGLKKKGHEVKVITQRPASFKGQAPQDYILLGVTRTFKVSGFGTEGSWGMPTDSEEIAKVLEQESFDVINFHEPWLPMLAWQMLKHSKAAHVGSFHANLIDTAAGKAWTSRVFTPYGRPLLNQMHLFTATTPAASGMLIIRADMSKKREKELIENLKYIPCGIELSTYKPVKKKQPLNGPSTKTIVYVGRLEKRKGVDYLLTGFAELKKEMPNVHLIIAGKGVRDKKLKQYVETEGIKDIAFPGYVSDEEKRRLLGNADLACFPSPYGEGQGIVLLEAMAMGTPLLAGNNAGYASVMTGQGRVGLVDPEATKDFANRMAVFLTDEVQRHNMVAWAQKEVKKYDYPKIVAKYEAAYTEAIRLRNHISEQKTGANKDVQKPKRFIHRLLVRRHA
ncbi:MAG TPA: glycosyltransferase family 4 protein, partial [Candidatus Saccharimonadales bacterium]|nr:glycosyltransferase family 4 protein [Candidatus Saccharimonadales bacterium]